MNIDPNLKPIVGGYVSIPLDHIFKGLVLDIYEKSAGTIFEKLDAIEFNQATFQVIEGKFYDIGLKCSNSSSEAQDKNSPKFIFSKQQSVIIPRANDSSLGTLSPNFYVGTLTIFIYKFDNLIDHVGEVQIEVRSIKANYHDEYKIMLDDIAANCIDLLLQVDSPVSQSFESDINQIDEKAIYQRFLFVKSMVDSKEFEEAVQKVISNPSTRWQYETEEKDIRNIKRFTSKNIREFVSKPNRVKLASKIGNIDSVPLKIFSSKKIESLDTPENRFVKHAVSTFLFFTEECERLLLNYSNKDNKDKSKLIISNEVKDARRVMSKLENICNQSFFKSIQRPNTLKLNSPILQRRSGYREILNIWLRYDLAAKFVWKGGENIYKGGKKNVAALYEYWLFFVLYKLFSRFNFHSVKINGKIKKGNVLESLFITDDSRLGLNLISGKNTSLIGIFNGKTRNFNICFSFNKTFFSTAKYRDITKQGSWTKEFRPDYTLSIWPIDTTEERAEENDSIVHIHFDSKYKLRYFDFEQKNENDDNEEKDEEIIESIDTLEKEKILERRSTYKNVDLYKMHAYKDAIRRTGGAYILYPGDSDNPNTFNGYHEILPGLGAFAIKPNEEGFEKSTSYDELNKFISQILDHFENRLTQRERLSVRKNQILSSELKYLKTHSEIPEYIDLNKKFKLIPADTNILVGYYRSQTHSDWIKKSGKYNIRFGEKKYSISSEMIAAKFILLYTENTNNCIFLKVKEDSKCPEIYSKKMLKDDLSYPNPTCENYLVYDIEEEIRFNLLNVRNTHINKIKNKFSTHNPKSGFLPFAITFEELLFILDDDK